MSRIKIISRPAQTDVTDQAIRISKDDFTDDRYHRFRLIKWWDQDVLQRARVVVIGAGAIGNEVLKNLALLGVGHIVVYDLDAIENSNLTRSVLFRRRDVGGWKAEIAAREVRDINPDCHIQAVVGDVIYDLGLGVLRHADLVLGCLDNIEARFHISRAAYRANVPFIDAGLDHLNGDVRVYGNDHACYECGLNDLDRRTLQKKMSCLKLVRSKSATGHIPTVPTISAIIAGLQVQIGVRFLHDLAIPWGKRLGLYGLSDTWFESQLQISDSCTTHLYSDRLVDEEIVDVPFGAADCSVDKLLEISESELGPGAVIDLDDRDLIVEFFNSETNERTPFYGILGQTTEEQARCAKTGVLQTPKTLRQLDRTHPFGAHSLLEIGIPRGHILSAKNANGTEYRSLLLRSDVSNVWNL